MFEYCSNNSQTLIRLLSHVKITCGSHVVKRRSEITQLYYARFRAPPDINKIISILGGAKELLFVRPPVLCSNSNISGEAVHRKLK